MKAAYGVFTPSGQELKPGMDPKDYGAIVNIGLVDTIMEGQLPTWEPDQAMPQIAKAILASSSSFEAESYYRAMERGQFCEHLCGWTLKQAFSLRSVLNLVLENPEGKTVTITAKTEWDYGMSDHMRYCDLKIDEFWYDMITFEEGPALHFAPIMMNTLRVVEPEPFTITGRPS